MFKKFTIMITLYHFYKVSHSPLHRLPESRLRKRITLQDIFMWIINLGIEIMGERKYGDFFQKYPNFVPQIKLSHFHAKLFQRNQNQFLMKFLKIVNN